MLGNWIETHLSFVEAREVVVCSGMTKENDTHEWKLVTFVVHSSANLLGERSGHQKPNTLCIGAPLSFTAASCPVAQHARA